MMGAEQRPISFQSSQRLAPESRRVEEEEMNDSAQLRLLLIAERKSRRIQGAARRRLTTVR